MAAQTELSDEEFLRLKAMFGDAPDAPAGPNPDGTATEAGMAVILVSGPGIGIFM